MSAQQSKRTGRMHLIGNAIDLELEFDLVFISVHVNHTSVSASKMNLEI